MQDRQRWPGGSALQVCPLAHCLQRLPVPVMPTTPAHCCCGIRHKVGGIARVLPLYCTPLPLLSPPCCGRQQKVRGGDCKGPAPVLHPHPPLPPFLCLPQQQLQSTCMHVALYTYKCLTYTPLLPKQNSKKPKVHPCRSTLHAILPGICHASV